MKRSTIKKRAVLAVAFFLVAMLFVFVAAQKKAPEIKEPKAKVSIDWWFQDWPGGVNWQKDWVGKFQSMHPNITVNLIPIPFDDLFAKLIPSVAQKTEPEIMYGYDEWVSGKDVSKLFLPLTPTLMSTEEFKEYVYEAPLKNVTGSDGNIYGYPFLTGANAFGFTYHKDLFKQAGIDPSKIKSWDDLKAATKKLAAYNTNKSI